MADYIFYPAIALTGGGDGALDAYDGNDLNDGDVAIVVNISGYWVYHLDDDSAAEESSPDVIAPDANAGNKRWILQDHVDGAAPNAHKDSHDPEDGGDPLDCAAPAELAGVQDAAEGTAHSFARSDHAHQIQHAITNNHIVTIDHDGVADDDYARFTASGLEGREPSEVRSDISVDISGTVKNNLTLYYAHSLIGGAAGALDAIASAGLSNGDGAIVITTASVYFYWLDDDSGAGESSPDIIAPDDAADGTADYRWILAKVQGAVYN